jgi:N-acyl-D-amino-acid deacylase
MTQFDVLIKDARIIDGTGTASYRGSIGIRDEKIAAIGTVTGSAQTTIDAADLCVCPGFIDPHSHADMSILKYPLAESKLMQGITTFVGGNCGISMAPVVNDFTRDRVTQYFSQDVHWQTFGGYLDFVEQTRPAVNVVPLVGHNPIRSSVMGEDFKRKATDVEIQRMQEHVQEAMTSGAFGFTTGLDSSYGEYADTDEIVALAAVAAEAGGLYATHVRHNQTQWPADSLDEFGYGLYHGPIEDVWVGRYRGYEEAIEVGQRARIHVHISHLANAYAIPQPHPDFLATAVARATLHQFINQPRQAGVQVSFDTIFAPASIATPAPLVTAFQKMLQQVGKAELVEKLRTTDLRTMLRQSYDTGKMKMGFIHPLADPFWTDCFQLITHSNKQHQGKLLAELIREQRCHPVDVLADLILEDPNAVWVQIQDKKRTPAGLTAFLEHPLCIPCTDTFAYSLHPDEGDYKPPAIAYGMYPGYLDTYVKQQGTLPLEAAIYRATKLPAQTFGLVGRGILEVGAYADVLVFDLESIRMTGDALTPGQPPDGMELVLVNGRIVYQNRSHTGARSGRVLRRLA